jgi:hypothetical protein
MEVKGYKKTGVEVIKFGSGNPLTFKSTFACHFQISASAYKSKATKKGIHDEDQ